MIPSHLRFTDPLPMATLASSLRGRLPALTKTGGRFRPWLADPRETLVILALDASGVLGWAAASPEERLVGVFVRPSRRRKGIGTALMDRLCAELRRRWPEAAWSSSTAPGSVGRRFMEAHDRRIREAA